MRYNDIITLIDSRIEYDDIGNSVKVKEETTVFANKYQVSMSEFYSANLNYKGSQHTIRNKTSFQIRHESYTGQGQYKYKDTIYDIIRVSDNGEYFVLAGVEKVGKD